VHVHAANAAAAEEERSMAANAVPPAAVPQVGAREYAGLPLLYRLCYGPSDAYTPAPSAKGTVWVSATWSGWHAWASQTVNMARSLLTFKIPMFENYVGPSSTPWTYSNWLLGKRDA
jgi:hypothetical protein